MKAPITPFTEPLYEFFMQALRDEEAEVNSNDAFAIGMLVEQSGVDLSSCYLSILGALHPLFSLSLEAPSAKITARDNAAGAVARMMTTAENLTELATTKSCPFSFKLFLFKTTISRTPLFSAVSSTSSYRYRTSSTVP